MLLYYVLKDRGEEMVLNNKGAFKEVGAYENNPKWGNMISRKNTLYKRENDVRSEFGRDYTRILHSTAYRRLKHKTQVFFSPQNDHICTRIEHVSHVESASFTIANYLDLNTELTKAISIGHDMGHAPFGHLGESIINDILKEEGLEKFWHEKNGLHFADDIELLEDNKGFKKNLDLTYAVRDGIISHCGEVDQNGLKPRDEFIDLIDYKNVNQFEPYTWEGCVVKVADKISYLGRDIEDAITLKVLEKSKIKELVKKLWSIQKFEHLGIRELNNTVLMHQFIVDLCGNSSPEKGLCLSDDYFELMKIIKDFNYQNIYNHKRLEPYKKYAHLVIQQIYELLVSAYDKSNTPKKMMNLAKFFPNLMNEFYNWISKYWDINDRKNSKLKNNVVYKVREDIKDYKLAVVDFISGMTDQFALRVFNEIITF